MKVINKQGLELEVLYLCNLTRFTKQLQNSNGSIIKSTLLSLNYKTAIKLCAYLHVCMISVSFALWLKAILHYIYATISSLHPSTVGYFEA